MKKIATLVSILSICILMILSSVPISNAQVYDKPSPCSDISLTYLNYQNGYNGYYIEVMVPDTYMRNGKVNSNIKGFHIQTISAKGKVVNSYYPSNLGSSYNIPRRTLMIKLNSADVNRLSKQYYELKARTFNCGGKYNGIFGGSEKPKNDGLVFSNWVKSYAHSRTNPDKYKAKRCDNKKKIKLSWEKVQGATRYEISIYQIVYKQKNKKTGVKSLKNPIKFNNIKTNLKTFSKISSISAKNIKSISLLIHALKDVKKRTYRTSYFPTRNEYLGYRVNVK